MPSLALWAYSLTTSAWVTSTEPACLPPSHAVCLVNAPPHDACTTGLILHALCLVSTPQHAHQAPVTSSGVPVSSSSGAAPPVPVAAPLSVFLSGGPP